MSSGPEGQPLPSPRGRIYDGICSDACVIQDPLTLQAGPYMTTPQWLIISAGNRWRLYKLGGGFMRRLRHVR
jgi:hypothetical protein